MPEARRVRDGNNARSHGIRIIFNHGAKTSHGSLIGMKAMLRACMDTDHQ